MYRRRNRILCLHGPTQSSASLRAALKPISDRLDSHWEFHFLDAPFIIPDQDGGESQRDTNTWTQAAILASRLSALDSELETLSNSQHSPSVSEDDVVALKKERSDLLSYLTRTQQGTQVWQEQQQNGADGVEALLSTKVAQSMSRDWTAPLGNGRQGGIDAALGMIGDYMREQGNVRGGLATLVPAD